MRIFWPKNTNIDQNVLKNDVLVNLRLILTNKHQNRPKHIEKRCFQRISDFFDQQTPKYSKTCWKTLFSTNFRLFWSKNTKIDQNVFKNDVFSEFATFLTNKHQNRPKRIENDVFSEFATFLTKKHQNRPKRIEKRCF